MISRYTTCVAGCRRYSGICAVFHYFWLFYFVWIVSKKVKYLIFAALSSCRLLPWQLPRLWCLSTPQDDADISIHPEEIWHSLWQGERQLVLIAGHKITFYCRFEKIAFILVSVQAIICVIVGRFSILYLIFYLSNLRHYAYIKLEPLLLCKIM